MWAISAVLYATQKKIEEAKTIVYRILADARENREEGAA